MRLPCYYSCEKDFHRIHHTLKQYRCPHCSQTGCLILHGLLYGYFDVCPLAFLRRGHRVFCSNRHNRKGCGRTCSILLARCLKGLIMGTHLFWTFIRRIARQRRTAPSFRDTAACFTTATAYRLRRRFCLHQSFLRSRLINRSSPPATGANPESQTILHLRKAFPRSPDPVSAFQLHFQTDFFAR